MGYGSGDHEEKRVDIDRDHGSRFYRFLCDGSSGGVYRADLYCDGSDPHGTVRKGETEEMIYLQLFFSFLQIGMFSFGGGYAAMPVIQEQVVSRHGWLDMGEFTNLITISQMTPGPIGINSATYVGYAVTQSVWGAVLATVAVCLPSFILVLLISYFFAKCKDNKYIKAAMSGLLPMSVALIASAALLMMNRENFIDYKSIGIFAAAFLVTWKWNLHPILLICLAGVVGLLLY